MQTGTLAAALEREHREIDAGIAAFAAGDGGGLPGAAAALRRHIYLEEEFLFPLLVEKEPGLSASVFVMLREHGQLWQELGRLDCEPAPAAGGEAALCRRLAVLLLHHNLKEEKILYPRADELLPAPAAARLREFITSGQMPPGWACAKAATTPASP